MSITMKKSETDDKEKISELKKNQSLVEEYVNTKKIQDIDYDGKFKTISKRNISDRDDFYTELLKHFVSITKIRNRVKEVHKWLYFWIIVGLSLSFVRFTFKLLNFVDLSNDNMTANLVMLITLIVSFSSVMIAIPLIITKYLFSSKEDKRIAKIILHTQQHDIDGKRLLENIKNIDEKLVELQNNSNEISNQEQLIELVTQTVKNAQSNLRKIDNN